MRPRRCARELDGLAAEHARDPRAHYFAVRDARFNPERERRRDAAGRIAYTPALAAMFIYLNRTGFNGLFRVNSRGAYNVPPGRYQRPRIVDRDKLARAAGALSAPGVELRCGSFESTLEFARAGDFLYLDPPYAPLNATSRFTAYTRRRLRRPRSETVAAGGDRAVAPRLPHRSSATRPPPNHALYRRNPDARSAGLRALEVLARRAINSNATARGPVFEYLITNQR